MVSISIPEGFETVALFSKVCSSGMCNWTDIKTAKVDMMGVYEIALMLDWREMCEMKARLK